MSGGVSAGRRQTPALELGRVLRPSPELREDLARGDAAVFGHAGLRDVDIGVVSWAGAVFEARVEGRRVGSCQLLRTWDDAEAAWVVGFYVLPEVRGRGFGREMLRMVAAEAGAAGLRRLLLTVEPANGPALNLYVSFGFRLVEEVPDFYGPGEHRSLLRCELPPSPAGDLPPSGPAAPGPPFADTGVA